MANADTDILTRLTDGGFLHPDVADRLRSGGYQEQTDELTPAVIRQESGGRDDAVSPKGARGRMQLMPPTAKEVADKLGMKSYDLNNREDNERLGKEYLRQQLEKYGGDPKLALAAYNAGPGRVDAELKNAGATSFEEIESSLPKETRNYVRSIMGARMQGESPQTEVPTEEPPPPTEEPGMLARAGQAISDFVVPPAEAEGLPPAPALPTASQQPVEEVAPQAVPTGTPQPAESAPVPAQAPSQEETAQAVADQSLQNAQASAETGDTQGTLASLSAAEQAQGLASPVTQLDAAFAMQDAGGRAALNAEAEGAQQVAQQRKAYANEVATSSVEFQKKYAEAQAKTQAAMNNLNQKITEYGNASIDPERLFKRQSTFATILMGIGAALQAWNGNTEGALKSINDAIDRDIEVQKADLAVKGNSLSHAQSLLNTNFSYLNSLEAAEAATRAQMLAKSQAMIEQITANTTGDKARAQAQALSGVLQQKKIELLASIQKQVGDKNAADVLSTPDVQKWSKSEQSLNSFAGPGTKQNKYLVQHDGRPAGLSPKPDQIQQQMTWQHSMNQSLDRLDQLYKEGGTAVLNTERAALMNKLVRDAHQAVVLGHEKGARGFSKFLTSQLETELPSDLFGGNMAGRAWAGTSRLAFDKVPVLINEFRHKYNQVFLSNIEQGMTYRTPEFNQWLSTQRAQYGLDPDVQKVK